MTPLSRLLVTVSLVTVSLVVASTATAAETVAVAAPSQDGTVERFGIAVDDRYRPLENLEADGTRAWIAGQAAGTRQRLESLPGRAALRARYDAIDAAQPPMLLALQVAGGNRLFYVKRASAEATGVLYLRDGERPERAIGDVRIGPATRFSVSPDGQRILLSEGGAAASKVSVIDVASGSASGAPIDDAWNGAAPCWRPDGAGFYYVSAPSAVSGAAASAPARRLMSYRFAGSVVHDLGASKALASAERATIVAPHDGRMLFVSTQDLPSGPLRVAFRAVDATGDGDGAWTTLVDDPDEANAVAVHATMVYVRTMKDATLGRLLRYDAKHPGQRPVTVFSGTDDGVLQDVAAADDGLYLTIRRGFTMSLTRLPYRDAAPYRFALPFEGTVKALATDPARAGAIVTLEGWTMPSRYLRIDGRRVRPLTLQAGDTTIGSDWVADALTCEARDGARIPMNVVHRRGLRLDGRHPLILNGYGGYGFVEPAYFYPKSAPWIERDGIFADFMPRGSGATGEAWHRAGMGPSKPKTWTDLEACAETLIAHGYTSPDRLIIQGTAIGGLMVGRAMTDRPDLFAAAVIRWGITDPLRFVEAPAHRPADELELGRPDSAEGVAQLVEASTDAHIRDGVSYPAVMLTTGLKDGRFPAWMQLKTAARLEAAAPVPHRPVLLRVDDHGGAGLPMTLAQRNDELADRIAFMLWIVGDPEFQPR